MTGRLRVAIVGAGPAGLYAAHHLLEGAAGTYLDGHLTHLVDRPVEVDVFERLVTPWGLVRHGVAPDHHERTLVRSVFDAVMRRPAFRYFGDVEIGRDVTVAELSEWYDAVIYAVGAAADNHLGISGEHLPGSYSAREFVGWYNGHPDYRAVPINLSCERAVIVGGGNVALDVARILTLPSAELARTNIATHALEELRRNAIREVIVLGRRSPADSRFAEAELSELDSLPGVDVIALPPEPLEPRPDADPRTRRKLATLRRYAERRVTGAPRRIVLRFHTAPNEIIGTDRVTRLRVRDTRLDQADPVPLDCGLVVRAIGFSGTPMPGLPFDPRRGVIPSADGRLLHGAHPIEGAYVTGWAKRGPRGIIGTNKKCARDTVRSLLADAVAGTLRTDGTRDPDAVEALLRHRIPDLVDFAAWRRLDNNERAEGGRLAAEQLRHSSLGVAGKWGLEVEPEI